jgi:DNA-directed RNA polymerase specialized sigma24 family protein
MVSAATVVHYRPALHAIALRLTGSEEDADALERQTYQRVLRSLREYRLGDNLRGWLVRLLYETYIDELSARSRILGVPTSRLLRGRRAWRRLVTRHPARGDDPYK